MLYTTLFVGILFLHVCVCMCTGGARDIQACFLCLCAHTCWESHYILGIFKHWCSYICYLWFCILETIINVKFPNHFSFPDLGSLNVTVQVWYSIIYLVFKICLTGAMPNQQETVYLAAYVANLDSHFSFPPLLLNRCFLCVIIEVLFCLLPSFISKFRSLIHEIFSAMKIILSVSFIGMFTGVF